MNWQPTPYALPVLVSAGAAAVLALLAWRRRPARGAIPFALLMAAVSEWSLAYVLELVSVGLPAKLFWIKIQYVGIVVVPVMWLGFALRYTGRRQWLTQRNLILLAIVPLVSLLLTWSTEWHGLMIEGARLDASAAFPLIDLSRGPWFWVHTAYSYTLLLLGTFLLLRDFLGSPRPYREQVVALLFATLVPWTGNVLYIFRFNPLPDLDLTSIACTASGAAVSWALFRSKLFDIVPIARDTVIQSMSDGVIVLDAQDRIVDLNPAAERAIGSVASDIIGQPVAQALPDWPQTVRHCPGGTGNGETIVLGEADAERTYRLHVSRLSVDRERPAGQLILLRDITERKQIEEALQESEELYRAFAEQSLQGLIVIQDFRVVFANRAMAEMSGYTVDELLSLSSEEVRAMIHPEDQPLVWGRFRDHLAGKPAPSRYEYRGIRKDGTVRWFEMFASRIEYHGRPAIHATVVDITGRKRLERKIEERRLFLEGVLEATPDAIVTLDTDHRVLDWNQGAEKLFGYSPEEAIGQDLDELVAGANAEMREQATGFTDQVLAGEPILSTETVRYRKDGTPVSVILAGAPIVVEDELVGVVGVYTDITERKRAEEALRRRATQLATLNRIGGQVASILDRQELLQQAVDALQENLGYLRAAVLLVDEEAQELYVAAATDDFWEVIPDGYRQPLGNGPIGIAAQTGETVLVTDASSDARVCRVGEWFAPSSLSAPIRIGERVTGVLEVEADALGAFDENDRLSIEIMADQIAVSIENAHLYEQIRRRALEQGTLREAALAMSTTLERDEVVERILTQLQQVVPYDTASVQLLEDGRLEIVGGLGFPNLEDLVGITFDPSQQDNPNSEVVRTRAPFVVDDVRPVYEEFRREPHAEADIRSWLGVPMLVGDQLIGMIALDKHEAGFYTEHHAQLAEAFAAQAAIAIENARLYDDQRRRAEEASLLLEIGEAINSTLEPDRVFKEVAVRAARACEANRCTILLVDEEGETLLPIMSQFATGPADPELGRRFKDLGYPQHIADVPEAQQVIQERRPLFIPDALASSLPRHWVEPFDARSILIVPLISRDRVIGLLGLDRTQVGRPFTREQVNLAMTIAGQAAVAIENTRLHRELRRYADELEDRVQKRTAQLEAQYAQLEAILNSSADGIVVAGTGGEVILANPVAQTWLNRTLSPSEAELLREEIRALAARCDEQPEAILELTGLDLQLRAAPISEPQLEAAAAVVAIRDVSHLKALDRVKTRFMSNVSHELRTPIATIKLYAHLMQRHPDNWREHLDMLAQEADHQARLVQDILQISRVDAGRLEVKPEPTALDRLVEEVIESHRTMADSHGVALERRAMDPAPVALVDEHRMRQVLDNLVVNAVRYTHEGGEVVVSARRQRAQGRLWATVTVRDTGMGIPQDELPHVFERFFRGEKVRSMQISGTGLGLAIVQEIVELHGGHVTVESQVNEGSAFTVWLPLADSDRIFSEN